MQIAVLDPDKAENSAMNRSISSLDPLIRAHNAA